MQEKARSIEIWQTHTKQFKTTIEAILQELPGGVSFIVGQLRTMYLKSMVLHLRVDILGRLSAINYWDNVADATINLEGTFVDDTSLFVSTY